MARVEVKTKKPDIHLIIDTGTNKDIVAMTKELYEFIALLNKPVPNPAKPVIKIPKPKENIQEEKVPGMRERLPNNVVDLNTLSITEAVKENALVRCPYCGQSHFIAVNSDGNIYGMRKNYKENKYELLIVFPNTDAQSLKDICYNPERELYQEKVSGNKARLPWAYWLCIQEAKSNQKDVDFVVNNETEVFCPVCGRSNSFMNWKDCYEHPLNYFEYDHICDACGGEMSIVKKQNESFYKCDKCGWESGGKVDV